MRQIAHNSETRTTDGREMGRESSRVFTESASGRVVGRVADKDK